MTMQLSPAHVWNAFTLVVRETLHATPEQAEASAVTFVAAFKQQLQAKADPKQRSLLVVPAAQMWDKPG